MQNSYKKPSYKKKRPKSLVKKVDQIARDIGRYKNAIEEKFIDNFTSAAIPGTAGSPQGLLHLCSESGQDVGSADARIGSEFINKRIECRFYVASGTTGGVDYPCNIRVIMFWDRNPNGVAPPLYTATTGNNIYGLLDNSTIPSLVYAPQSKHQMKRFKILYDETIHMEPTNTSSNTYGFVNRVIKKNLRNVKTKQLNTATDTIADITANALWIYFVTDCGASTASAQIGTRIYFTDQ